MDISLIFLGLLNVVAKMIAGIVVLMFRPVVFIFRFLLFKILVKSYLVHFSLAKKLGWDKFKGNFLSFLVGRKTVHIFVMILTVYTVFIGLSGRGRAQTVTEGVKGTIIAEMVKSEFGDVADDELIEEGFNEESMNAQTQLKYLGMAGVENKPKASLKEEEKAFTDSVISDKGDLVRPDVASTRVSQKTRTRPINYTIKPGDTISTIAQEFGISVNTILWENNLSSYSLIRPGDELTILPGTGVGHKVKSGENLSYIAKKYDITVSELMKANRLTDSSKLSIGKELFIPGGRKVTHVASKTEKKEPAYNPISTIKKIVSSQPVSSNKMAWPTDGYKRITQYYSWRHHGLDLADNTGTLIFAADAGTVTYSGWSNGYGYRVDVDHGGGKKTRYAHLSKIYFSNGASVTKGQAIGEMGSTGWSTGPHLHFEVIINNRKYNPLNYIK